MDVFEIFLTSEALAINKARQDHLASLELDLAGKSVLEVGAGIGLHTKFFEDLGCSVLCTDGRPENVAEIIRRYPHRKVQVLNLDQTPDISSLGMFAVVYCYGTLYHLSRPEQALAAMAAVCKEMILLETCVTPGDDIAVHLVQEDANNPNQSIGGIGYRPTRPWVMTMLKKYFGYAYVSATQPRHPDFDLNWVTPADKLLHRAMFIGAKMPLDNPYLLEEPPDQQTYELIDQPGEVWLDVGAYLGEKTFEAAKGNPNLTVYAFEPNLSVATQRFGLLENFVVIPMAVAECDGFSPFYLNSYSAASSLLPFNPEGLENWIGREELEIEKKLIVPTIRLDTFLNRMGIAKVDLLKIDAQGGDFAVIVSAGERLKDIRKIVLEAAVTAVQLYSGAAEKSVVVDFLQRQGFVLTEVEGQSHGQEENLTFIRGEAQ